MIGENLRKKKHSTDKRDFYSRLNIEDISDADYTHARHFVKISKLKK